jgi:uncharacterized membrane-anchored protein
MTAKIAGLIVLGWIALVFTAGAQDNQLTDAQIQQLAKNLKYQQGKIKIQDGLATIDVSTNFYYLNAEDAKTVLVKFWGNPPAQAEDALGMLMPSNLTPLDPGCWAVVISYSKDGYVKDDDASKINYDDLLKKMQTGTHENNKARTDKGYPAMELVGWATPPHYDAATHKLYWATEYKIDGADEHTLNYDIRILGRRGILVLTAIAGMSQLPEVEKGTPDILPRFGMSSSR